MCVDTYYVLHQYTRTIYQSVLVSAVRCMCVMSTPRNLNIHPFVCLRCVWDVWVCVCMCVISAEYTDCFEYSCACKSVWCDVVCGVIACVVYVCVCVCVWERVHVFVCVNVFVRVCARVRVCVWGCERVRERNRKKEKEREREREQETVWKRIGWLRRGASRASAKGNTHSKTYQLTHSTTHQPNVLRIHTRVD